MKASIVIPAYNAENYISQSLDSLIKQSFRNWEAIIVNDGSSDHTEEIALNYCKTDNRIKLINQPNKGVSIARNRAITAATGDILAFLDADDLWPPDKLEVSINEMKKFDVDLIFTSSKHFTNDKNTVKLNLKVIEETLGGKEGYNYLLFENPLVMSSVVVKKKAVEKVSCFDENLQVCEDYHLWLKLAKYGYRLRGSNKTFTYYRRHEKQATKNILLMWCKRKEVIRKISQSSDNKSKHMLACAYCDRKAYMYYLNENRWSNAKEIAISFAKENNHNILHNIIYFNILPKKLLHAIIYRYYFKKSNEEYTKHVR